MVIYSNTQNKPIWKVSNLLWSFSYPNTIFEHFRIHPNCILDKNGMRL